MSDISLPPAEKTSIPRRIESKIFHDHFQNYKRHAIPKAQLVVADIPYNIGKNAYGSNPAWYEGGDSANGESKLANTEFFDTDKDFRISEFLHFCSTMLIKEPKETGKAPCMVVFCAFDQQMEIIEKAKEYGLNAGVIRHTKEHMSEKVVIGDATLYHGDCREVLPLLPPVDLVLTDPPYGISRAGQQETFTKERKHKRKHYDDLGWDNDTPPHWFFGLLIEKSTEQMIWGGNYFTYALPPSMGWLYWDKGQDGLSMSDGELCFTSRQSALRAFRLNRGEIAKDGAEHPTQKPLRLMTWCLSLVPEARTVCDPFMGSGTTGVACARMGLQFVGIERERKYFDIACERIARAQAQGQMFAPEPMKQIQEALV